MKVERMFHYREPFHVSRLTFQEVKLEFRESIADCRFTIADLCGIENYSRL